MELISEIVKNDLFIFIASVSSIVGLIIALVVNSKVTKIKKYIDNSKKIEQDNVNGNNKATIT